MTKKPTYEELEQRAKELEKLEAERKRAEEELQDAKQKWMSLIENTNDFIMIIDDNGKIQYINRAIPPHTVTQVTGKTLYDYSAPEHHEMIRQAVARVFETREQGSYTSSVKHPTGIQWFETTMVPIIEKEKVRSAMTFNKIITESKQAEEALRKAYDELENRVEKRTAELSNLNEQLKQNLKERKQAEEILRESKERFRMIFKNSSDGIIVANPETKKFQHVNPAICKMLGYTEGELTQMGVADIHPKNQLEHVAAEFEAQARGEKLLAMNIPFLKKNGKIIYMDTNASIVRIDKKFRLMGVFRDITDRKLAEEALKKVHDELEQRVEERTRELEIKTRGLEEINVAMTLILKKREEDKIELEDNVLTNVKELVEPYLEKIKKTKLDDQQEAFFSIIESNLKEIISPFTRKMSLKYLNLTPTEIQVANMTKHGNNSKKIAKVMNISPRTVDTHKKNIRRKIGLQGTRGNLRSHLLAFH